jgi:hypothetical protein
MAPKGGIRQRLGLPPRDGLRERSRSPPRGDFQTGGSSSSTSRPLSLCQPHDSSLRSVLRDLFLANTLSAVEASRLARGAERSGAGDVADMASAGSRGTNKNVHRDLVRSLLRGCTMPSLYFAKVPLWQQGQMVELDFPFLLPHEVLGHLHTARPDLLEQTRPAADSLPELRALVAKVEESLGVPGLLPVGLHGDGVPYSKRQSLEALSWNFPGQPQWERILFTAVPKKHCCQCGCKGKHTFDKILEVFTWSMRCCLQGAYPSARHDGQPLERERAKLANKALGSRAFLAQVRGDWPFLKQLFQFPGWNSTRLCWRCKATQDTYRVCHADAPWRSQRISAVEFLQELQASGVQPSPLLGCPGFRLDYVAIDWLHTVDLGVSQDILGNVFCEFMATQGGNKSQQLKTLWQRIRQYYQEVKPSSQLDGLTWDMVQSTGKSPKLKAKGGETRYLVPLAAELAQECLAARPCSHSEAVSQLVQLLLDLYHCVGRTPFDAAQGALLSRRLCVLYQALAQEAQAQGKPAWVQKPKLHLLQELMEYSTVDLGSPQNFWTYKDESWVGWLGKAAHRRGGADTPVCAATRALSRYRALASESVSFKID